MLSLFRNHREETVSQLIKNQILLFKVKHSMLAIEGPPTNLVQSIVALINASPLSGECIYKLAEFVLCYPSKNASLHHYNLAFELTSPISQNKNLLQDIFHIPTEPQFFVGQAQIFKALITHEAFHSTHHLALLKLCSWLNNTLCLTVLKNLLSSKHQMPIPSEELDFLIFYAVKHDSAPLFTLLLEFGARPNLNMVWEENGTTLSPFETATLFERDSILNCYKNLGFTPEPIGPGRLFELADLLQNIKKTTTARPTT